MPSTIKFNVLNYWSGDVQFTATIKCAEDELPAVKLGLAVKWAVKNGASLDGASLVGARLDGASLVGARLDGARLDGARLGDTKIKDAFTLGYPNGWGAWTYVTEAGEQRVQVGCRNKTIAEGRAYWANKEHRREVVAVLDYAEAIGRVRGWDLIASKSEAA